VTKDEKTKRAQAGGKGKGQVSRGTTAPTRERVQAVTLKLPLAYLHILDHEAQRLRLKRGAFLTLLLQRKRGDVRLQRATDAPTYEFKDKDLTTFKLWIWYMTPETRKRRTRKDGATGVDGQTATQYEKKLDETLASLIERLKSGVYHAPPVRRVFIPKAASKCGRSAFPPSRTDRFSRALRRVTT
jgi:hypothetical protein